MVAGSEIEGADCVREPVASVVTGKLTVCLLGKADCARGFPLGAGDEALNGKRVAFDAAQVGPAAR